MKFEKAVADFDIARKETPDDESIENYLQGVKDHKERSMGMVYVRQNERKEWEQVTRRNGKIESLIPFPDYEDELDERRREERDYWRLEGSKIAREPMGTLLP